MKIFKTRCSGVSMVEATAVIILILAVLVGFGGYIKRSLAGRWHGTGDAVGQGRQYDPRGFGGVGENSGTMDCFYDQETRQWVDEDLYRKNNCDCTFIRADRSPLPEYTPRCIDCKTNSLCASPPG